MIVYNVTFSVDKEIAEEWLSWMKDEHLPSLSGLFKSYTILKVLSHEDDQTDSFAVQYYTESMKNIELYHANEEVFQRYGERVLSYPTLLREV